MATLSPNPLAKILRGPASNGRRKQRGKGGRRGKGGERRRGEERGGSMHPFEFLKVGIYDDSLLSLPDRIRISLTLVNPLLPKFCSKVTHPPVDLSVGDIRWLRPND